jgi:Flp pilus assembly pilin Flp
MRRRDERGAVAVEFALVFPLLVVILFLIITSGISYSNAIGATNAVREGARFGATADATQATWLADVIDRTRDSQFDDPANETHVCVKLVKLPGTDVKKHCEAGTAGAPEPTYGPLPTGVAGTCVVQVAAARWYTINAVFHQWREPVSKSATARYERAASC